MAKQGKAIFSATMKLADMIESNYKLLNVLSRFGISLGFGENTIEHVCNKRKIDTNAFLLICNTYSCPGYIPSGELLDNADLQDITLYLHNSHLSYMESGIAKLERYTYDLMESCDSTLQKIIRRFLSDYRKEVKNHFDYEEQIVFPYVTSISEHHAQSGYSIEQFKKNHGNIEEKLGDLKNIVMKYLPESCDTVLRNRVLYHIFLLKEDLDNHTLVENNILIPIVNKREMYEHGKRQ